MIAELVMLAVIAGLYVLGAYQGSTIANELDLELEATNEELDPIGRFILVWGWPVATVMAMMREADGN